MFSSPSQGFERAHAVFTGKIVQASKAHWIVEVNRVWKGEVESQIVLTDAHAESSFAASYKLGESYLFLVNVEAVNGTTQYSPQVCNWGTRLKGAKVALNPKGPARRVEEWVLMGHGEGRRPIKILR
jgi:hypothetical protein